MTIDKAIREYRLIQRELSQKIHKSERMIKRYENGETIPSIQILGKIFNKSIDEMISLE